ncbi:MAG: hypothetical protein ACQERH_11565, partial [Acidobacteriota bacterium]
ESPVRAERAWFLFRGERSPNRERDSTLGNRTGDESLALPLICQINFIAVWEMLPKGAKGILTREKAISIIVL